LIGDPKRIAHVFERLNAQGAFPIVVTTGEQRLHFDQLSANRIVQLLPLSSTGPVRI
jgi:hypothetical protein